MSRPPRCPPRPAPRGVRGRSHGFSLVELMVAVGILAILASLTFVSLESMLPRAELNSAVRELASTLHQTRSDALTRNAEFSVEYYFEAGDGHPRGYRVVTPFRAGGMGGLASGDEERLAQAWHALPDSVRFTKIAVADEEYTDGQVVVRFDAFGSASDHRIYFYQEPYGNEYTIEVLALTGMVRFHDGHFEREYPKDSDFR